MPARCSIVYGLPGDELDSFIGDFAAAAKQDPFTTWLILPTSRLVQTVRDRLDQENVPYLVSRICTLDGLCRNYFEENRTTTRYLSKAESKILLNQVLIKNKARLPLFFFRSHPSTGTTDDLRQFINVVTTRKVMFPECLLELQSEKSDQIDLIISEYRTALLMLDLVDSDTIMEWTIDHLAASEAGLPRQVFMYGILNPLPLEQDLLSVLRERSESFRCMIPSGLDLDVFTDPLEWAGPDADKGTFHPPATYRTKLTGIFSSPDPVDTGGSVSIATFSSHYAELQGIASEICRIQAAGVPLSDIAVAFPELRDEFGIIGEVFSDFGIRWNVKISPKLSAYPAIRFLISIPGVVANRYSRDDVVRLVNSPYFQPEMMPGGQRINPDEIDLVSRYAMIEGDRGTWLRRIDRLSTDIANEAGHKVHGIDLQSVERVKAVVRDLFSHLKELEGKKSLKDFIGVYRNILEIYGLPYIPDAPDEPGRAEENRIVKAFDSRLKALSHSTLIPPGEKVGVDEFIRMLNTIVEEPDGSRGYGDGGVSVLGIRECAHQHFPYLFICRMVEGAIPSLTTRLPFTNSLENVRMGTRSLADTLHEGEYYFMTALLSGERVYLSAPLAEGDKPLLTSAFFERVRERCGPEAWNTSLEEGISSSRSISAIHAGGEIGEGLVCRAVEWTVTSNTIDDLVERVNMERYFRTGFCDSPYDGILSGDEQIALSLLEKFGPHHVYSPTTLEVYAQCPLRFFFAHLLYLKELPEVEPNLSASDRGTMVHNILTLFYRRWNASGRPKVSLSTMTEAVGLMREITEEEIARYSFESPLWEATCIQMKGCDSTGPGYLERFLESESEEEGSPLVPFCFEISFGMEHGDSDDPLSVGEAIEIAGPEGTESLCIRGRIDRVDQTPEGLFLIYDYKTGGYSRFKDIETGKALQLPLYTLAFEAISGGRGVAAGYYGVRKEVKRSILLCDETGRAILVSRPRTSPDFSGILDRSREFALEYIGRIRKGEFPLPHEEKCPNTYCEFRRICRFNPYRVFDDGEVA